MPKRAPCNHHIDALKLEGISDDLETAFDLMAAMDKVGEGIGGDVGHGVSELALTARSALDNVRDAVRAMTPRGTQTEESVRPDIVIRLPYDEVDPLDELDRDIGSVFGLMRLLRAAALMAKDDDLADGAHIVAEQVLMMMENAREIVARLDAGRG